MKDVSRDAVRRGKKAMMFVAMLEEDPGRQTGEGERNVIADPC